MREEMPKTSKSIDLQGFSINWFQGNSCGPIAVALLLWKTTGTLEPCVYLVYAHKKSRR